MAIALKSLLKAAKFPKNEVDELMLKEQYMTDDEKFDLAETAWYLLSQKYFSLLNLEKMIILQEVKQGKRKYNLNDIEEIKAKLLHEFAELLRHSETEEQIGEVREQLEKYKSKPLSQDKKASTSPPQNF